MNYRRFIVVMIVLTPWGCARRSPPARPVVIQPEPRTSTYACLQQVLKLPVITVPSNDTSNDSFTQINAGETLRIHTSLDVATDLPHYTLHINDHTASAFITSSGGIGNHIHETHGPWSTATPQVMQLLDLVRQQNAAHDAPTLP